MPICTTQFEWEYNYMILFGKDLTEAHEAYRQMVENKEDK